MAGAAPAIVLAAQNVMKLRRSTRRILACDDVLSVEAEAAFGPVLEPALEGRADGTESDLGPRDVGLVEQRDLQRFLARLEFEVEQPRAVEKVYLVDARHRDHAEWRAELDPRAGFLEGLAQRGLAGGLVVLHEPGGQGPVAVARLDRAPAQQQPAPVLGDRADHQQGVLIVDHAAPVADPARQAIARGHAPDDRRPAIRAEFQFRSESVRIVLSGANPSLSSGAAERLIQ